MKFSRSIVTQKGDFNAHAGIQDIVILDVFNILTYLTMHLEITYSTHNKSYDFYNSLCLSRPLACAL